MKLTTRHLFRGKGQHRKPAVFGAAVGQRFAHCPACGVDTAVTVHGPILRCAEGHEITAGGAR